MKEIKRTHSHQESRTHGRRSRGYEPAKFGMPSARPQSARAYAAASPEASQYARARYGQQAAVNRRNRRGDHFLSFVIVVAAAVFIASIVALGVIWYGYHSSTKMYDDVASHAVISEETSDLANITIDWDYLKSVNKDVVAWVYMPGTEINYPIVKGADDDEYLWKNFDGGEGAIVKKGSIFLSGVNSRDMSDDLSFFYGHNMHDGTMFSLLEKMVNDTKLFDGSRTFYVLTPTKNYRCSTFALDRVDETKVELIQPTFSSADEFQAYLNDRVSESLVSLPGDVDLSGISKSFALVSCAVHNDGTRVILYGGVVDAAAPANAQEPSDAGGTESVDHVAEDVEADVAAQ